jgi:hypothetical protein
MGRYGSMLTLYNIWFDGMMLGTEWNVYILHISRSTT